MKNAVYAIKKGFIIGNHSYNHPHFTKLKTHEAFQQIKRTDELIDEAYKMAGVKRPGKIFRFPYLERGKGEKKKRFQKILKDLGYSQPKFEGVTYRWYKRKGLNKCIDVDCTYDTMDWATIEKKPIYEIKGLKEVLARMDENVPEGGRGLNHPRSNEIIMMHDFEQTAKMFVPMIEKLLAKGLKFKLPRLKIKKEIFQIRNIPRKDLKRMYKLKKEYTGGPNFEVVKKQYSTYPGLFIGCYRNGRLIGVVTGEVRRDSIHLSSAAVNALYWRKGLGSKMIRVFDEEAKEIGKKIGRNKISVCSGEKSESFYLKNGYRPAQLLVWIRKRDVPKDYKHKGFEVLDEKNRKNNKILYLKMQKYDPEIKEIVKKRFKSYKVLYIFEKKL